MQPSSGVFGLILGLMYLAVSFASSTTAIAAQTTFEVPGRANLYQRTGPEVGFGGIDPVRVPQARLGPGQRIQIVAVGCVVAPGSRCTGPDGFEGLFNDLPVYSLIGRWSRSPDVLDNATVASAAFFVGSFAMLAAPAEPGDYYLFLGENDGNFADNSGAYVVTATWEDACQTGALQILRMLPSRAGNTGRATLTIDGCGLDPNATVTLLRPGTTVDSVLVEGPSGGTRLLATFDLNGRAPGVWALMLTNPTGETVTKNEALEIIDGGVGYLVLDVVGPARVRAGRETTFTAVMRNEGLVDLDSVLLAVVAESGAAMQSRSSLQPLAEPLSQALAITDVLPPGAIATLQLQTTLPSGCSVVAGTGGEIKTLSCELLRQTIQNGEQGLARLRAQLHSVCVALNDCPDEPQVGELDECTEWRLQRDRLLGRIRHFHEQLRRACQTWPARCGAKPDECQAIEATTPPRSCRDIGPSPQSQSFHGSMNVGQRRDSRAISEASPANDELEVCAVTSLDPNLKVGPAAAGMPQYVHVTRVLPYTVLFENIASATAPAQEVVITDQISPKLDPSTLFLGDIRIGNKIIRVPDATQSFATTVDLRPAQNVLVGITAGFAPSTRLLTWRFACLDPDTGQACTDPLIGFLPPNSSPPEGEGAVAFVARPWRGLVTGTEIRNGARIVFDANSPIDTPPVVHTVDATAPTSRVLALAPAQATAEFVVQWGGEDADSGIRDYTIFVSEGGAPYTIWQRDTTVTSETFTGRPGKRYTFYSLARDGAHNIEEIPSKPDAATVTPTTFADVDARHPFLDWIEALFAAGITGGCSVSPARYCPDSDVTRAQMAVFLLRGLHGVGYEPPAATGTVFTDTPLTHPFAPWIEQFAREGVTGGCSVSPSRYCPDVGVTRSQMAVFLLRTKHGASYSPPAATGTMFADVTKEHPFAAWIEQLAREGITGGCATSPVRFCPGAPVTRGQMAVFLVRAFGLPL